MPKHRNTELTDIIKELEKHPKFKVIKTKKGYSIKSLTNGEMYNCHSDLKACHNIRRFTKNKCDFVLTSF